MKRLTLLLAASLLASAAPARAGISFTANQATFAAGSSGLSTQGFNGFTSDPNSGTLNSSNSSNILPGLNFATSDGSNLLLVARGGNLFVNPNDNNTNQLLSTVNHSTPIVISFALPQTAISVSLLDSPTSGQSGTPTIIDVISTTGVFLANIAITPNIAGTGTFEGILATNGSTIGSIVLSQPTAAANSDYVNLESISFKAGLAPAVVPEPASALMLGLGLAGTGVAGWRRSRRS